LHKFRREVNFKGFAKRSFIRFIGNETFSLRVRFAKGLKPLEPIHQKGFASKPFPPTSLLPMRVVLCNIRVKQESWIEGGKGIP
jgi:hypothetical protein